MRPFVRLVQAAAVLARLCVQGQGTFFYDQQSSTYEAPAPGVGPIIQQAISGQSFTPSLSGVDFIRLKLSDRNPSNLLGAALYVNLLTNSINGPVMASSQLVGLADSFAGVVDFVFTNGVPLVPGVLYYFRAIVQSGGLWRIDAGEYRYPGGTAFDQGITLPGSDLWFREGIVIPEPSAAVLILTGVVVLVAHRLRKER